MIIDTDKLSPEQRAFFSPAMLAMLGQVQRQPRVQIPVDSPIFDLTSIHQRYWKDFCDVCYSRFGFEQGEVRTYEQKYETFCRCKNYVTSEEGYEEQLLMTKEEDLQRFCDILAQFYNLRDVVHMIPMLLCIDSMVKTLVDSLNADAELIKRIYPRNLSVDYRHYMELLQRKPEYRKDVINDIRLKDFEEGWLKDILLRIDVPPYVDDCFKVSDATRKIARRIFTNVIVSISELIDTLPVEGVYPRGSELQAFVYHLFMSYECSLDELKEELDEYPSPLNLEHLKSECETLISEFLQTDLGKHWCDCIEHKNGLQNIAKYFIHHSARISEEEEHAFFYTLDKICIISDILEGKADKYWLEVEYPEGWIRMEEQITVEQLSESRQQIVKKLLKLVGKGDWIEPATENGIKEFIMNALGVGTITMTADDNARVTAMWKLLETGRGDRITVVFQNLIGYFVSRGWLQEVSTALNKKFFGTKNNYTNINKGNPQGTEMSEGFKNILPLLDKCAEAIKS